MTHLYNCKSDGDEWRITKFTENLELVEGSSYLCTPSECQCPAGVRPTCRHREMLPKFFHRGFVDTGYFFDYDRGGWVDMRTEDELEPEALPDGIERDFLEGLRSIPGVQVFTLDDPATLHNAIAEAVGEPEALLPAPAKWRRF